MIPSFVTDLAQHGDRVAIVSFEAGDVTYAGLARRVADVAQRLRGPKRLIAVEAAACLPAITAYLGALAAGHAVALLPQADAGAFGRFDDRFRPETAFRRIVGRWRWLNLRPSQGEPHPDLALLMMTSGSTGQGKGVRLSGGALNSNASAIASFLGLGPADRAALILPLHYAYGLSVLNAHLAVGASVWLHPASVLEPGFLHHLREARCTNLAGVPHSYDLFDSIGLDRADLPDLRLLTVAGGALPPAEVRRWSGVMATKGGRFFVMYGQTEATARIAYLPPDLASLHPDCIGIAIPGGELSLNSLDGQTIEAPDVEGELVYRGPNVMMGYATHRADLELGAEVGALATGDLAVRTETGLYRITARLKRMSKIAGLRIGHDALEAALAAEGMAAAVIGDDRGLTAAYTGDHTPEAVREAMIRATGLTARHVAAEQMAALPRLSSGKVAYDALRQQLTPTPLVNGVPAAFRHCFHPRPVALSDSFASLGGDSLRHVELSMDLERLLGSVPANWEQMRLSELAGQQRAARRSGLIGTDLVIRALSILAVVVHHQTLWPVFGGSAAMVILIGYSLGRFQRQILASGDRAGLFRPLIKVLAPYYLILLAYAVEWGRVPWLSVFLVGNFGAGDPVNHEMLPYLYWFIEAYAQMLVVLAAFTLAKPVRRWIAADPFRFGLLLLVGACLARQWGPALWPLGGRQIFTLPWVFHLCAFGWCIATADTLRRRLIVLAAAALVMPWVAWAGGNWFGAWIKYGAQFGVITALLFLPLVRLPAWVSPGVLTIARASFLIYLLHRFVPEILLLPVADRLPQGVLDAAAIIGGIGLGILASSLQRRLLRCGPVLGRPAAPADRAV